MSRRGRSASTLATASRWRSPLLSRNGSSARLLESHRAQHFLAALLDLALAQIEIARTEGDLVSDRGGEDLMVGVLKDVAGLCRGFGRRQRGAITTAEHDHPRGRAQQADQMLG